MTEHETVSLAGQAARIKRTTGEEFVVVFDADVKLEWAGGRCLSSNEPPTLHPEITGHVKTKEDYTDIKDAELILDDLRVFRISFFGPSYFSAHESINSRNRVYPE